VERVSTSSTSNTRLSVSTVTEKTNEDPFYLDVLSLSLEEKAQELRRMYGTCEATYILRETYKLPYKLIAKLLGIKSVGALGNCVQRIRSRQQSTTSVPAIVKPALEDFKEVCKSSALGMECQMLESEAFMFAVAKASLPATAFWDVFIYAKAAHRVVFPDVYNFLVELANMDFKKLRRLLRAVRVKDRWYVGDGVVAYVYSLLDKSCFHRGYYNTRLSFNTLTVIELLTRKNPTREPLVYLSMAVSDRLTWLISTKRNEIVSTMKEVYATVTRMYDLD
jgi:hypothetical protein